MALVVADTSPLFYLLSIGHIDLLPRLFGKVLIPDAVHKELCHPAASTAARQWMARLPPWVEVTPVESADDAVLRSLGAGERAAITLALSLHADLVLIHERKGTNVALGKGLAATGMKSGIEVLPLPPFASLVYCTAADTHGGHVHYQITIPLGNASGGQGVCSSGLRIASAVWD